MNCLRDIDKGVELPMGSFTSKMKKEALINVQQRLVGASPSEFDRIFDEEVGKRAKVVATEIINDFLEQMSMALVKTFQEDYGFGDKRRKKLMSQLNYRLPSDFRFNDLEFPTITQDKLYDLVELLLELGCDHRCKRKKDNCNVYGILKTREIPIYSDCDKVCEYRVMYDIPEKLSKKKIQKIQKMLNDRRSMYMNKKGD